MLTCMYKCTFTRSHIIHHTLHHTHIIFLQNLLNLFIELNGIDADREILLLLSFVFDVTTEAAEK